MAVTCASWPSTGPFGATNQFNAISTTTRSDREGSIQDLNLKEIFLLLSSTGLAYRRCGLVRVNGTEMDTQFLKGKNKKKPRGSARDHDAE